MAKLLISSPNYVKKIVRFLENYLFYNGILRLLIESYLVLTICSVVNLNQNKHKEIDHKLNLLLSILTMIILISLPLITVALHFKGKDCIKRHSTLFEGLKEDGISRLVTPLMMLRRFAFVVIVVFIEDNQGI